MNWWRWWVGWLDLNEPREMLEIAAWEYAELLGRELPDVMVEMEEDGSLYLRREGDPDPVVMNLPRMVARLPAGIDAVERQEIYASWLETLQQVLEGSDVEPSWADRLLVRLVTKEWVESSDAGSEVLIEEVPGLGLYAALVFDFPSSVRYVMHEDLAELGLSAAEARERAFRQLRDRMPSAVIREQLSDPKVATYTAMDSYDAARILVLPELLSPGEQLGVAIPDRDTLVFFPADGGAELGRQLADSDSPDGLLDYGVRVTCDGFEVLDEE